jgi:hypothetical protein
MENWGLVTYRETCLLVDPENTSAVRKQWIALVVGHELAHQWFGNLVTMVSLGFMGTLHPVIFFSMFSFESLIGMMI